MQKLSLKQKLSHKLSGQQIQFVKLLQVPTVALHDYVSKEITMNPLLEGEKVVEQDEGAASSCLNEPFTGFNVVHYKPYKTEHQPPNSAWIPHVVSLQEKLKEQLYWLDLDKMGYKIGEQLIGSLDQNGYLKYDLSIIVQDLYTIHGLECTLKEVEEVLLAIQCLDPPGIAARTLQECLLIQLYRQDSNNPVVQLAQKIIRDCFDELAKKHYEVILKKLAFPNTKPLKEALDCIARLNPKPGYMYEDSGYVHNNILTPEFIVLEQQGKLVVELIKYPNYKLRFNKKYLTMLEAYEKKEIHDEESREMVVFLKKKLEDAKWFMEALAKRSQILLKTMQVIFEWQCAFFNGGEETSQLVPMVLKNVADQVGLDTSTISRIVNQKSVQTRFGIYPLKFFFSEGINCLSGQEVSNKVVKNRILELITHEDKQKPYTDEYIVSILMQEGYRVARRTVTKYREQLNLPVARLRKGFV